MKNVKNNKFKQYLLKIKEKRYSNNRFWTFLFFLKDNVLKFYYAYVFKVCFSTYYFFSRKKISKKYRQDTLYNKISFCTTSMNRLCHIKKTLIKNIKDNIDYPHVEFVLLDYSSTDGLKDWVDKECEEYVRSGILKYYRIDNEFKFHMSRAKNLAHSFATGDVVCNIDADHFTCKDFAFFINHEFNKNKNIIGFPCYTGRYDFGGRIFVSNENFKKIGGYDENFIGWGHEDTDFKDTAIELGLDSIRIPILFLDAIKHSDDMRDINMPLSKEDSYKKNIILFKQKRNNEK